MEILYLDVDSGEAHVRGVGEEEVLTVASPQVVEEKNVSTVRPERSPTQRPKARPRVEDFTGKALLSFALFFLFWVPGAVSTLVFLAQAREVHRRTGVRPAGLELLEAFTWMFVYIPLGIFGFLVLMVAAA
jgi:hypothetical protein